MPKLERMIEDNSNSLYALGRIPHDNDEDRVSLQATIQKWIAQLEQVKWPRGLQYFENVSYLSGNHLTRFYYTADSGFGFHHFGLHDSSQFDNLVAKVADNRLIRPIETVTSMLTQTKPQPRIEPNSEDPADEDAAEIGEMLIELMFEKPLNMPEKLAEVAMIGQICGTAAIEVEYGETDVPVVVRRTKIKQQKNPFYDADDEDSAEPEFVQVEVEGDDEVEFRRDLISRVWTPFHLNPDPAATSAEDMTWIGRSTFEDVDWIVENFAKDEEGYFYSDPEELKEHASGDSATRHILYWWSKFQDIIESPQYYQHGGGLTPQTFSTHGGSSPGQTVLTVIDVKPTRQFPRGRTLITAGEHLIYAGDARSWSEKYPWRWHPYAFWSWFKIPGRFWGIPLLSELVPLQKKINAIDSLVQANRQYLAIGQWLLPRHAKVAEGSISGIPGENLTYTAVPGMIGPERVRNIPLPQELLAERESLLQAIDYISASGVIGDQLSKSAARSGVILDFLRQEKLRSKSSMLQSYERMLETVAQNILIEIQLHLAEEDPELTRRMQTAAREHSSMTIGTFIGASLRDHHAVSIDIASELMHSPEAREGKALEAAQYLGPQMTPVQREAVFKAIGLDRYMKDEQTASIKKARRTIARIINGQIDIGDGTQIQGIVMQGIDQPSVMAPVYQTAILADKFNEHPPEIKTALVGIFDILTQMAEAERQQAIKMQIAIAQATGGGGQAAPAGPPAQ